MMSVEQSVEWEMAGETEALGENLHLSDTNPTWTDQGSIPSRCGGEPTTNRRDHISASVLTCSEEVTE
jgi:hypothetical protein